MGSWWIITAFNPMGQLAGLAWNEAQHSALRTRLNELRPKPAKVLPSWHGLGAWREEGFTVHFHSGDSTLAREAMLAVGRDFCQAALYMFEVEGEQDRPSKPIRLFQEVLPCFAQT